MAVREIYFNSAMIVSHYRNSENKEKVNQEKGMISTIFLPLSSNGFSF